MWIGLRARSAAQAFLPVVLFVAGSTARSSAEERPRALPKDGAWVRWQCENKIRDEDPMTSVMTLRLVGTVVENGRQCRWIERKQEIRDGKFAGDVLLNKLLVPELELLNNEQPLDHIIRMRIRRPDGQIQTFERSKMTAALDDWQELLLWTPAMLKASESAQDMSKDIEHQDGKLTRAEPRSGSRTFPSNSFRQGRLVEGKGELKFTVWQHPDVPLGFAEAQFARRRSVDGRIVSESTATYRLQAFGFDAQTELGGSE